jgi:hypothetical protein
MQENGENCTIRKFIIYFHHVIRAENIRILKLVGRVMVMRDLMEVHKVLVEKAGERTV